MHRMIYCSGLVFFLMGCGKAEYFSATGPKSEQAQDAAGGEAQPAAEVAQAPGEEAPVAEEAVERKIIYVGRISLVVEQFEELETAIPALVKQFNGYLAEANVNRTEGRQRFGRWTARVPAERFAEFLTAASQLGIAEQQEQTAQDVTMEYIDLEERIKAKKSLEQRILELLENREGKLSDVIEAERELARVRSEIESMEGRLRYLQNQTRYSTVTIEVREEQDYVPAKAPDFPGRIGKAWQESLQALKQAGEGVVIAAVALAPWILPLALMAWLLRFVWKRLRRGRGSEARGQGKTS